MEIVSSGNSSNIVGPLNYGVCREMLDKSIPGTKLTITYWNIALVSPNIIFLIFIVYHIGLFSRIFLQRQFPIVKVLLILVFLVCIVNVIRGFIATIVKNVTTNNLLVNEILWLLLRFLLLAVEISVIGFGLFGYGSTTGIGKRVLSLSFFLALVFTTIQSIMEFTHPNHAEIFRNKFMMFHHGGMLFWSITSSLFFIIYSCIVILPKLNCLCARGFLSLPSNRAFYRYAAMMCVVNLLQSIGSVMVYKKQIVGLCILNASVLVYYSLYAPLVYWVFLRKSFKFLKSPLGNSDSLTSDSDSTSTQSETNGTLII